MRIFDKTLATLERALDARLLRQNVLAGNLANVDTPGFTPRDVDFGAAMAQSQAQELPLAPARPGAAGAPEGALQIPVEGPLPAAGASGMTGPAGAGALSPIVTARGAGAGLDGNSVDLDRTLTAIAENGLQYGAAARAAGKKLAILRYVASDGAS